MGLFDKKYCSICGAKIGLLGNRKLEDGNLCKECASKLSPFFEDRRQSTVDEIREQLAYREQNRRELGDFHVTRTLGRDLKVLLDEDKQKFVVTRARDIQDANPDVIDYAQVTGCEVDVSDSQSEVKRKDAEGKMVSYVPPKFTFSASVRVIIHVNHRYFDTIYVPIDSSITLNAGNPLPAALKPAPRTNREFMEAFNAANEIKRFLTTARAQGRAQVQKPKQAVVCPCCGATTIPDANGCCEYCGGATGR